MAHRWRGRTHGLAIIGLLAVLSAACGTAHRGSGGGPSLLLTDAAGEVLERIDLPSDGSFALEYRNSLYGTRAREDFRVVGDELLLVGLGAEQLAVLEEYYAIRKPATPGGPGGLAWSAASSGETRLAELRVAATDLGRRTLLVEGWRPIRLYDLVVDDEPTIVITAERR